MGQEKTITIVAAPARVLVTLSARKACEECGGAFAYELDASVSGCAFGDTFVHTKDCKSLLCPHGIPWIQWGDCEQCNAQICTEYGSEEITEDLDLVVKLRPPIRWKVHYERDGESYRVWESRNAKDDYELVPPEALALVLRGYESNGIHTEEGIPE